MTGKKTRFKDILRELFTISGTNDIEVEGKIVLLNIIFTLSVVFITPFIFVTYAQDDYWQCVVDVVVLLLMLLSFFYLRHTGDHWLAGYFVTSTLGFLFLYLITSGGLNNSGPLGSVAFPLLALFLLGMRKGTVAVLIFLAITVCMFFLPGAPLLITSYSNNLKLAFTASFLGIYCLAFFAEWVRAKSQEKITGKTVELEQALQNLKHTEGERSMLQDELLSAKKMEAIGTLAGGMAHEFNNQVSVVLGNTDLLLRMLEMDELTTKKLKSIQRASDRIAVLTDQLLSFSRKQILRLEKVNINQLIRRAEYSIGNELGIHIQLVLVLEPKPDSIEVDSGQIIQVIMDLILNSRDAMKNQDSGTLTITTENILLPKERLIPGDGNRKGRFVCLSVEDTGTGMDKETQQKIYEPFFTTKNPGQGIGLGMSFVYGTVKQHNGWMELSSTPGKGTAVKVFLPSSGSYDES
ncbi:MAG: hypothetical protein GY940_07035 [bacterium]|nr:hypothetical protein [bacterium]